jgi:hypothetical protein
MSPLADSIKKTLSYFAVSDYPLTKEELFGYLWQPPIINYEDFLTNGLVGTEEKNGYYFLDSESDVVEKRRERLLVCEQKLKIAIKAARKIRSIPFIRAVFVCNTIGAGTASQKSDIDFFIITAPKRIWLVRFFANLILKFWGLRVSAKHTKDKVCLSFFVDENSLNLDNLRVVNDDVYLIYWIHQLIPVFDPDNICERFLKANNWTTKFLPNALRLSSPYIEAVLDSKKSRVWKKIWQKMWDGAYGDLLESQAKGIQMSILKKSLKKIPSTDDKNVILSDQILKFHENDARAEIYKKWKSKIG